MRVALIEPPGISLRSTDFEGVISPFRQNHPIASQLAVAAHIRDLVPEANLQIHNFKHMEGPQEKPYGVFPREGLIASFVGATEDQIKQALADTEVVCITASFTFETRAVKYVLDLARQVNKNVIIVVGGNDASARPEFYREKLGADVVVQREVEGLSADQLRDIFAGRVKGVMNGNKLFNPNSLNLPPFDLVDVSNFSESHDGLLPLNVSPPVWTFSTSRGCPHSCSFCSSPKIRGGFRPMNLVSVEKHLDHLKNHRISTLLMDEDNFLARSREEILTIMEMLKRKGFTWEWPNGLELGKMWNPQTNSPDIELIQALYEPPCYRAMLPIEKLAPDFMGQLRKLTSWDKEMELFRAIREFGPDLKKFTLIIGTPDETKETLQITEERAIMVQDALKSDTQPFAYILCAIPIPGSQDYRNYMRQGCLAYRIEDAPEFWNFGYSVINGRTFTAWENTNNRRNMLNRLNGWEAVHMPTFTLSYYQRTHEAVPCVYPECGIL